MADIPWLIRKACSRVWENYPHNFSFRFDEGTLAVDCLWRIVGDERLIRTSQDHGQQFGLPAPIDAYAEAESILRGRSITSATIRKDTADLVLTFDGGYQLEIFADSSGYEPWNFTAPGIHLIAIGGGGISNFSSK